MFVIVALQWDNLEFGTTGTGARGLTMLSISSCFLVYVVVKFLSLWVHEGSHALVAYLAGCRVTAVVVGSGPRLASEQLGSAELTMRLLPMRGQTNYLPTSAMGI